MQITNIVVPERAEDRQLRNEKQSRETRKLLEASLPEAMLGYPVSAEVVGVQTLFIWKE
jgi:hypothetical protein